MANKAKVHKGYNYVHPAGIGLDLTVQVNENILLSYALTGLFVC